MGVYENTPKTQTSARDIPLTDALTEDLKEYMAWFREADRSFDEHLDEYYLASNLYREPLPRNGSSYGFGTSRENGA